MTDSLLYYFAFGSNLSTPRLRQRIPEIERHGIATLDAHRLCWHKNDRGQSGKCDIEFSDDPADQVYGVVFRMSLTASFELDRYECSGLGYLRRQLSVDVHGGERIDAFTYRAIDIDRDQLPFHWYKEHVLRGALEHGLPEHYVESIRATPSIDDPDDERHHRELAIYRAAK